PNLDTDIVVEGDGLAFAGRLAELFSAQLRCHRRFGTAVLAFSCGMKVDVATARKEAYARPGALPAVSYGDIAADLARRDFSINAMAVVINGDSFGRVVDYFNGIKDIARRRIKVLHSLSFVDDPTRMLRAARFEQRYGFRLERKTSVLFKQARQENMLSCVSRQRIREELILCLKEPCALKIILRIGRLYGWGFVSDGIELAGNNRIFLKDLARAVDEFPRCYRNRRRLDRWIILFIGLLDGLSLRRVLTVCRKFAFRRGDECRILSYFRDSRHIAERLKAKILPPSGVYRLLNPLSFEAIVLIMVKYKKYAIIRKRIDEFLARHNRLRLNVSGADLKRIGLCPGPHFKKMLLKTLYAKIDSRVKDKQGEIEFIRKIMLQK
ncbi:MAG: hypothetical protein ACE5GG_02490, partial [Candidatus Omnitrophota bacterium]